MHLDRDSMTDDLTSAYGAAGENGTPNTRAGDERSGRYARYSMASSTSKDVPPDAKMLTLLQQYREAQEERLRIEGARSSFPNSQPPVQSSFVDEMEQVAHGAQGKYVRYALAFALNLAVTCLLQLCLVLAEG